MVLFVLLFLVLFSLIQILLQNFGLHHQFFARIYHACNFNQFSVLIIVSVQHSHSSSFRNALDRFGKQIYELGNGDFFLSRFLWAYCMRVIIDTKSLFYLYSNFLNKLIVNHIFNLFMSDILVQMLAHFGCCGMQFGYFFELLSRTCQCKALNCSHFGLFDLLTNFS